MEQHWKTALMQRQCGSPISDETRAAFSPDKTLQNVAKRFLNGNGGALNTLF